VIPLTDYERQQIRRIAGWKAEPPALVAEALDVLAHPLVSLAERLIPEQVLRDAVRMSYEASEVFAHREQILAQAGVQSLKDLRGKDLAFCDGLAAEFARKAGGGTLVRSAALAGTGGASVLVSVPLMMTYCLKTVHTIGYCYGFSTHEPREREYVLGVLRLASAASLHEKQDALGSLRDAEEELLADAVEELAEEAVETALESAVEDAAQGAAEEAISEQLMSAGALRALPLVGIAFGAATDAAMTGHVANVAQLSFQERWLRVNRQLAPIAPDPALARDLVHRVEGNVGRGVYWACFTLSFLASFPPLLLASLVPGKSSVAKGCAAGRDAARQDLARLARRVHQRTVAASAAAAPRPQPQLAGG